MEVDSNEEGFCLSTSAPQQGPEMDLHDEGFVLSTAVPQQEPEMDLHDEGFVLEAVSAQGVTVPSDNGFFLDPAVKDGFLLDQPQQEVCSEVNLDPPRLQQRKKSRNAKVAHVPACAPEELEARFAEASGHRQWQVFLDLFAGAGRVADAVESKGGGN